MKKAILCFLLLCLFALSTASASDTASVLTEDTWIIGSSGSEIIFDKDGKGKFADYDMTYEISGDSITISYSIILAWGDSEREYPVSFQVYLIEENGYKCLANSPDATWKTSHYYQKSHFDEIRSAASAGMQAYDAYFGEEIDLGTVKFTLNDVKTIRSIGETGYTIKADESGIPLVFLGTIENTGKKELNLDYFNAFLTAGNETLSAFARTEINGSMEKSIPALGKGKLYIAVNLNDEQRSQLSGASLVLSLNENIDTAYPFPCSENINLKWTIDREKAQSSSVAQVEKSYFEECPALPTPDNFIACSQSSHSTMSSNNKTTSIKYMFGSTKLTGNEMAAQYSDHLQKAGYSVKKSGSKYTVSYKNKKLAEFQGSGKSLTIDIIPGNQNFSSRP